MKIWFKSNQSWTFMHSCTLANDVPIGDLVGWVNVTSVSSDRTHKGQRSGESVMLRDESELWEKG